MNNDLFLQLSSTDYFFYYGEGQASVEDECRSDLLEIMVQDENSLYFMRDEGAGIKSFEGAPISLMMMIFIPYNIANSISKRNTDVSDGSEGYPDRRIALSQKDIEFSSDDLGNVNIQVPYYLYSDIDKPGKPKTFSFSTAGVL